MYRTLQFECLTISDVDTSTDIYCINTAVLETLCALWACEPATDKKQPPLSKKLRNGLVNQPCNKPVQCGDPDCDQNDTAKTK